MYFAMKRDLFYDEHDVSADKLAVFKQHVYDYYRANTRDFPWRKTRDPYAILVSEIMLQQTQTYRVEPKYNAFMTRFPTVQSLGKAPLCDVLAYWQGLGYNRRALMLKRAAEQIVENFDGYLPEDPETLQTLAGVGPYTACAVSTFAFEMGHVFIETNIRTVFLHHFFPDQEKVHDKLLLPLIAAALDRENPRDWYYALMDYGVYLKKTYGNANKRSRHYTKQSKFEGSDRQVRGEIIRQLVQKKIISPASIANEMSRALDVVTNIFAELVAEQLIAFEDRHWYIK